MTDTKAVAKKEAQDALTDISQAIDLLSRACGRLSRLENCVEPWETAGKAYDTTKEFWHEINQSIPWDKIDLDSDARRKLLSK